MTGYQGWFRTPNDIEDGGWSHWVRTSTMTPENFTIDMWPDLTEYDPCQPVPRRECDDGRAARPPISFPPPPTLRC